MPDSLKAVALLAALLAALPSRADDGTWRHDKPCGQRQASMALVASKECHRGWCATTELGKLCACVKADSDDTHFSLERVAGARQAWKASFVPPMGGDADHFRIDRFGDGYTIVRYAQTHRGLPVIGKGASVRIGASGQPNDRRETWPRATMRRAAPPVPEPLC